MSDTIIKSLASGLALFANYFSDFQKKELELIAKQLPEPEIKREVKTVKKAKSKSKILAKKGKKTKRVEEKKPLDEEESKYVVKQNDYRPRIYNNRCLVCKTKVEETKSFIMLGSLSRVKETVCFCENKECQKKYEELKCITNYLVKYDKPVIVKQKDVDIKYDIISTDGHLSVEWNLEQQLCLEMENEVTKKYEYIPITDLYKWNKK